MKNLPKSLLDKSKKYSTLDDGGKFVFIDKLYHKHNMSYDNIAELCGTYKNRIRRDALRLGVKARDKSQAQKIALQEERSKHPTEGTKRTAETKVKISDALSENWSNLTPDELQYRKDLGKARWDSMTEYEKSEFHKKAGDAIRKAAKDGSKLEKYLKDKLVMDGYQVEFHKSYMLTNEKLQIDIYLPNLSTVVEVDGPSHYYPIWGEEALQRNLRSDANKDGLLLGMGMCVVRIVQTRSLSDKYKRDIYAVLHNALQKIEEKFPVSGKRYIKLGDKL